MTKTEGRIARTIEWSKEALLLTVTWKRRAKPAPNPGARMKAAYEAGLAREPFASQRTAFEILVEEAFERLKQAAHLVGEHARKISDAMRSTTKIRKLADDPSAASRRSFRPRRTATQ